MQACPGVHSQIRDFVMRPILCGFNGTVPVVCCTSENMGPGHNEQFATKKVGDLANEYCTKYSLLTHTWTPSPLYNFSGTLIDTCRQTPVEHSDQPYPIPVPREYPYLVALAVGPIENIEYICTGTLISEQFVLTTTSCAKDSGRGFVKWALAGDFNLYEELDDALPELNEVDKIFTNVQFNSNLALVKVKFKFELNRYVIPACLPTNNMVINKAFVTGWYLPKYQGDMSKALLQLVLPSDCQHLINVRSPRTNAKQICGKPFMKSDYCQRTIGDPLVVHRPGIHCMYDVIGVTSHFGQPCDDTSLFDDVASNIPWLEQVIWAQEKSQINPNNGPMNNVVAHGVGDGMNSSRPVSGQRITPPLVRPSQQGQTVSAGNSQVMRTQNMPEQNYNQHNMQAGSTHSSGLSDRNMNSYGSGNFNRFNNQSNIQNKPQNINISTQNRPMRGQSQNWQQNNGFSHNSGQQNNASGQTVFLSSQTQNDQKKEINPSSPKNEINRQIVWFQYGETYRQSHIRTEISQRQLDISDRPSVRLEFLLRGQNNFREVNSKV